MTWEQINRAEYRKRQAATGDRLTVGATLSDPDGTRFGEPRMLTEWLLDGEPFLRHQCWPIGGGLAGYARPCVYDRWTGEPSPSDVADADLRAELAEDAARDTHHERSER